MLVLLCPLLTPRPTMIFRYWRTCGLHSRGASHRWQRAWLWCSDGRGDAWRGHRLSCELSLRTEISGSVLRMLKDVDLTAEVVLRSQEATEEEVGAVSFQEGSFVNCRAYD